MRFYEEIRNLLVIRKTDTLLPMGCTDRVLPETILKNRAVNCLTFDESTRQPYNNNLYPFGDFALQLHGIS